MRSFLLGFLIICQRYHFPVCGFWLEFPVIIREGVCRILASTKCHEYRFTSRCITPIYRFVAFFLDFDFSIDIQISNQHVLQKVLQFSGWKHLGNFLPIGVFHSTIEFPNRNSSILAWAPFSSMSSMTKSQKDFLGLHQVLPERMLDPYGLQQWRPRSHMFLLA